MKKFITLAVCLIACSVLAIQLSAQQSQLAKNNDQSSNAVNIHSGLADVYTYKIFQAPNKLYGYDIFKNGKGVFHQTVPSNVFDASAMKERKFAEKAAMVSIDKLKNNTPPVLSTQEIKNIISQ